MYDYSQYHLWHSLQTQEGYIILGVWARVYNTLGNTAAPPYTANQHPADAQSHMTALWS